MAPSGETGVSVIICCHNSAGRIRKTLQALSEQEFVSTISWEVILVDNASTDNTSRIAIEEWEKLDTGTELLTVAETRPGLGYARKKGTYQARYSILLFCDDDNWLYPNYIQTAFDILQADPKIAACGGMGLPVFETAPPDWFNDYAEAYAVGSQKINTENENILNLYGAGLIVHKNVIHELQLLQFNPMLQGRSGKKLTSSEDTELTYAFVLMGYRLHYCEELKFYHYLPKERLNIAYLKKLFLAFGEDGPIRNLYYAHISNRFFHKKIRNWFPHFLLSMVRLVKYFIRPPKKNGRFIYFNWNIAYIRKLIAIRRGYEGINRRISGLKKRETLVPNTLVKQLAREY